MHPDRFVSAQGPLKSVVYMNCIIMWKEMATVFFMAAWLQMADISWGNELSASPPFSTGDSFRAFDVFPPCGHTFRLKEEHTAGLMCFIN